jgi:hypothetical protein
MASRALRLLKSPQAWGVAFAAALALALLWHQAAYLRGMLRARLDHARGHHEVKTYGGPPAAPEVEEEHDEYVRLLRARYGVVVNRVAGCVVTQELVRYVEGYNATSRGLPLEQYGKDIFAECAGLARRPPAGGPGQ